VIDTETTGIDTDVDEVVEVGIVRVVDGQVAETIEQMVEPGCSEIPAMASATHHLTKQDLVGKPVWSDVRETLALDDIERPVAHNAPFDAAMCGMEDKQWLDTLRLAKFIWRDLESYKLQFLRYYLKLDVDDMSIPAHRALGDALVTAALARRIFDELDGEDPYTVQEQPIRQTYCMFGKKYKGYLWSDVPGSYLEWMKKNVTDIDPDTEYTLWCELKERGL